MSEKFKVVLGRVEKVMEKRENAGYQHFLLFPHCFQKASFSELGLCGTGLKEACMFTCFQVLLIQNFIQVIYSISPIKHFRLVGWLYWGLTPL